MINEVNRYKYLERLFWAGKVGLYISLLPPFGQLKLGIELLKPNATPTSFILLTP